MKGIKGRDVPGKGGRYSTRMSPAGGDDLQTFRQERPTGKDQRRRTGRTERVGDVQLWDSEDNRDVPY